MRPGSWGRETHVLFLVKSAFVSQRHSLPTQMPQVLRGGRGGSGRGHASSFFAAGQSPARPTEVRTVGLEHAFCLSSPLHTGAEAVHAPETVHRTSSGPTSTDPSSQAKLQLAWCGGPSALCRQLMRPRSGGLRGGHRVAKNNRGQRVSSRKPRSLQQLPTSPCGGICLPRWQASASQSGSFLPPRVGGVCLPE